MKDFSVLGKSTPIIDSADMAAGKARFAGDMSLPGMLWGKILHSPHPHARVLNIDAGRALKLAGVFAVCTGKDISDKPYGFVRAAPAPPFLRDKFALARDKVRYIGDSVAAVAAVDEETAEEALRLIDVDYEILPAVYDPKDAMNPEAPRIHDHADRNVSGFVSFHLGDIDKGFRESDFILEEHFETQYVCHASLETHSVVADYASSGELTVWPSTQVPFFDRVAISETLGIPLSKVRVIKPFVGAGFGGKAETHTPFPVAALLSRMSGRPVKIVHSREEEFMTTSRRHPVFADHRIGVKKDGRIMSVESKFFTDGGAYNSIGQITIFLHGVLQNGPYFVPNYRYEGYRIYTNKPFCGAQRGHGGIQARFVVESMLDMAAEKLGMDPVEIRIKNGLNKGDYNSAKWLIRGNGHRKAINKARETIDWKNRRGKPGSKGVGIASTFFSSGASISFFLDNPPSHSGASIEANQDGGFILRTGITDNGQGAKTVLAMIAAEEIGVTLKDIKVIAADTAVTPLDLGSFSSRVTLFGGNAVKMAASRMKEELVKIAADELEANFMDLEAREGRIYVKGSPDKSLSHSEVITTFFRKHKRPLNTEGYYNPPMRGHEPVPKMPEVMDSAGDNIVKGGYNPPPDSSESLPEETPAYSFGSHASEVEVDTETGIVKVNRIVAAMDCGMALNPMAVEGQIEGALSMAFGQAFTEEFRMDRFWPITTSFLDYKLPTAMDMPPVQPVIVESNDPEGPFGATEVSEGANVPTIPSITNAIYDAVGVRIRDLPITPEKILDALEDMKKQS